MKKVVYIIVHTKSPIATLLDKLPMILLIQKNYYYLSQKRMEIHMEELLEQLINECSPYTQKGALANYIPELTKADPNKLGAYIISSDGKHYYSGDYMHKFTI